MMWYGSGMRKLASIQKIESLTPIEGADKILLAKVLGWNLVVKIEEFKVGDLCVYFEIDSVLDSTNPYFNHLKKDGKLKHLRTIKLRGQVSQGLALPISCLSHYGSVEKKGDVTSLIFYNSGIAIPMDLDIGTDVSDVTKTTKYEPQIPACLSGMAKGNFPSFLRKTDEPRVQNFPDVLREIYGVEMIGTMKCDGTSTTYYLRDEEFGVCSRNLNLKETEENSQWIMARKLDIETKMRKFRDFAKYHDWDFKDFAIQGELCGNSIQANKMKLDGLDIFFFNFWDITNHKYRSFETLQNFCKLSDLKTVPVVFKGILPTDLLNVDSILKYADKLNYYDNIPAEGIVWRPFVERESDILNGRLSFKTISNRFLLNSENN